MTANTPDLAAIEAKAIALANSLDCDGADAVLEVVAERRRLSARVAEAEVANKAANEALGNMADEMTRIVARKDAALREARDYVTNFISSPRAKRALEAIDVVLATNAETIK